MADRRTKIILSLDDGPYKRGLASAAAATKAFTKELDTSNERMSWLVQSSLALGPALAPIGASVVPAVTALSAGLAASVGAAGAAVLAFQGVGDGVKALNEYALEPSADNLEAVRTALANLAPAGREFVLFLDDLRPKLDRLQATAQAGLFPGVMDGIEALMTRAPQVNRIIGELTGTMGDLVREAGEGLASNRWNRFFDYMETEARPILSGFGRSLGNFTEGIANMMIAFDPLTNQFTNGMLNMSRSFAKWSRELDESAGFQGFVDYVERVGPDVVDTLGTLVVALADIVQAAAPIGEATLPIIEGLARALAAVAESPAGPVLIGAAAAISTLSRAIALSNVAGTSALFTGFQRARAEGGKLGKTADALAGKFSKGGALAGGVGVLGLSFTNLDEKVGLSNTAMGAMLGAIAGPWGAAVGGGIGLVKDLASANDGLESAVDGVNRSLARSNFDQFVTDLRAARNEARKGLAAADPDNFGDFTSPAEAFRFSWEKVTGEMERADRELDLLTKSMRFNWQRIFAEVKFPEGGGFSAYTMSLDDLRTFARRAQPALDQMGVSLKDLENVKTDEEIRRIARGIAAYHREADSVPARSAQVRKAIKALDNPMISAADSADKLEAALNGLFSPALDAEEALLKYKQGVVDLRKQLNKTNGTLNINTKAGRTNRQMIVDHVNATMELATAQARQDGNSKRAIRTLKEARQAVINAGKSAGMSDKQIREYLRQLNFTRGTWTSKIKLSGAEQAENAAKAVMRAVNNIPFMHDIKIDTPGVGNSITGLGRLMGAERDIADKHDINIDTPGEREALRDLGLLDRQEKSLADKHDINTNAPGADKAADDLARVDRNMRRMRDKNVKMRLTSQTRGIINDITKAFDNINIFNADGRTLDFYGSGGIRENHVAQIAPAGATRIWAEPETGGEAYIPFARSKRGRSRDIADETVKRLGGQVLWNRDGAVYAGVDTTLAPDPSIGLQRINQMYSEIAVEFGKGLGQVMEYALSRVPSGFSWPLPRQYQPSGTWGHYASGGSHPALDWPAPNGTPIYPVMPGRVLHTTSLGSSYGNYTEIAHGGGLSSLYAHQLAFRTNAGDTVFPGQTIGLVDSTGNSTGPHLHLELQRNGVSFDYTSMLSGGGSMGIVGLPGQYHGDHSGLDRASPSTAQAYAHSMMGRWGWSEFHWPYWSDLGFRESGWRWDALNESSGAYGIPQSLPAEKMAASGPDWRTNAGTQIDWMGNYIAERYGSPYKAIAWHNANNWYRDGGIVDSVGGYARGGMLYPGQISYNELRRPERILDPHQTELFEKLVMALSEVASNSKSGSRPAGVAAAGRTARPMLQGFGFGTGGDRDKLLQGFGFGTGRKRRRRRDDDIETPDITRKAQRELHRAERALMRSTEALARRAAAEKEAQRRVNKAQRELDNAKGKKEKKDARASLDDAKTALKLAEKRQRQAERDRTQADRQVEKARDQVRQARQDQRTLDRAVRGFNLRGGMGRADVRAEFGDLLKAVRQTMGKDSPLFKALRKMGERARDVGKRLDEERKLRDKLNDRLRNLRDTARQYEQSVRQTFRNDPFTGGLDEFALQLRADRNDANSMRRALNRARNRGLSGGLYKQLAASGNLELAQQFSHLSRAQIRRYERLFEQRQKSSAALGDRAAEVVYGKRLDRANKLAERQNMLINRLRDRLERIEDRVGDRIEAGARRGVREGMNGRKKMLRQRHWETRG